MVIGNVCMASFSRLINAATENALYLQSGEAYNL